MDQGPLTVAREHVQGAAKWYVAALGAIGAILLAGSQLSSLGALEQGSFRLWVAIVGVVVGLVAVLWAVSGVVKILAGQPWTFEDAVRAAQSKRGPVGPWLSANASALGGYASIGEIQTASTPSEAR